MRSRCSLAPSNLPRTVVNKYGGAEITTYDGVLKNVPQTWTDIVLIYKFANQTTTPLRMGTFLGIFHPLTNYGFVLPRKKSTVIAIFGLNGV